MPQGRIKVLQITGKEYNYPSSIKFLLDHPDYPYVHCAINERYGKYQVDDYLAISVDKFKQSPITTIFDDPSMVVRVTSAIGAGRSSLEREKIYDDLGNSWVEEE